MRPALLAIALLLACAGAARADSLVSVPSAEAPRAAAIPGVELTGHGHDGRAEALASPAGLSALRAAGLDPRILVADVAARDREDREQDADYARRVAVSPLPSGRTGYRRLPDYLADLDRLVSLRPDLVKPVTLSPNTLLGKPIRGVEISRDVARRDGKPVFLQLGLHHAREWPSGELPTEFAFDLVANADRDPRIGALLNRVRVVVIPVVNPDGFDASREAPADTQDPVSSQLAGLVQNGTTYRRKNCRSAGGAGFSQTAGCTESPGVDLNRNYGIHWGGNGASSFEPSPDFRGAGPFSEPESEAIRRFVRSRQVTTLITNHTFGNLVLRPPGVKSVGTVPDEAGLKTLGDRMAALNGYSSERSWELYDNSGTTEDWSYGVTGGFGYTFEIGGENFHPPYERAVVAEYARNREPYLVAMEHAAGPAGHAVLEGFAPPGRVLRVRRTVRSQTSPICVTQPTGFFSTPCPTTGPPRSFTDELESAREVGPAGAIEWRLNPSSSALGRDDGAWELTCETASGEVLETRSLRLSRGARVRVDLACGAAPCRADRVLDEVAAKPVRGGRAVHLGARLRGERPRRSRRRGAVARVRPVRVELLRVSRGRRATRARAVTTLVAPRTLVASRLRPGVYVARFSAGRDVRRAAFSVGRDRRVGRAARFAPPDGCRELRTARLASPVFGGTADTAPRLLVRPVAEVTLSVRILRGGRTVARLAPRRVAGDRTTSLPLPGAKLGRGAYTVRVATARGTPTARRVSRRTLRADAL